MSTRELILHFEEPSPVPFAEERKLFAEGLRANPGRVALLGAIKNGAVARQYTYSISKGKDTMHMFAPAGSFEAATKTMFGATWIFVCYVGQE